MTNHKEYYKGEGCGFPPNMGCGESCESMYAHGSHVHQKCSNYALTNLLFSLCRSKWIIDLLVIHPNPHFRAPIHPFYLEVLWTRKCITTYFYSIVFIFRFAFESFKKFGGASWISCFLFKLTHIRSTCNWMIFLPLENWQFI
jgi:hypothetical protein